MRNYLFLIISIVTCIVAIMNSDFSSGKLMDSFVFPVIAFLTLAASLIFFVNRNADND